MKLRYCSIKILFVALLALMAAFVLAPSTAFAASKTTSKNPTGYTYTLDGNSLTIVSYNGKTANLTVPATIDGYSVKAIGDGAFANDTVLSTLSLPSSVSTIGSYAFLDCDALTNITIPNNVCSIGSAAFYGCDALKTVDLSVRLREIPSYMFYGCAALQSITVPYQVRTIGVHAFSNCTSLATLNIPPSAQYLDVVFAKNCPSLTICGAAGSRAQGYASANGIPFSGKNVTATSVEVSCDSSVSMRAHEWVGVDETISPVGITQDVIWKTSDPDIVALDNIQGRTCLIANGDSGSAVVKLVVGSTVKTIKVTVSASSSYFALSHRAVDLDKGDVLQLKSYAAGKGGTAVTWSSSNMSVASVDATGLIQAKSKGQAEITATLDSSGDTATCTVTVWSTALWDDYLRARAQYLPAEEAMKTAQTAYETAEFEYDAARSAANSAKTAYKKAAKAQADAQAVLDAAEQVYDEAYTARQTAQADANSKQAILKACENAEADARVAMVESEKSRQQAEVDFTRIEAEYNEYLDAIKTAEQVKAAAEKNYMGTSAALDEVNGEFQEASSAWAQASKGCRDANEAYEQAERAVRYARQVNMKEFYQNISEIELAATGTKSNDYRFAGDNGFETVRYFVDGEPLKSYTHLGEEHDATSLENVRPIFQMLRECNEIRARHNQTFGTNLQPLKISTQCMVAAQMQVNWSDTHSDRHSQSFPVAENLASGFSISSYFTNIYNSPYYGWYDMELEIFQDFAERHPDILDMSIAQIQINYPEYSGKFGHYLTLIDPRYTCTGFAISTDDNHNTFSQTFATRTPSGTKSYDIDVYEEMFEQSVADLSLTDNDEHKVLIQQKEQARDERKAELDSVEAAAAPIRQRYDAALAAQVEAERLNDAARNAFIAAQNNLENLKDPERESRMLYNCQSSQEALAEITETAAAAAADYAEKQEATEKARSKYNSAASVLADALAVEEAASTAYSNAYNVFKTRDADAKEKKAIYDDCQATADTKEAIRDAREKSRDDAVARENEARGAYEAAVNALAEAGERHGSDISTSIFKVASVSNLKSAHSYEDNAVTTWSYTLDGASALKVVFDSRTSVESNFDRIIVYGTSESEPVGIYTGTSLAGKTLTVLGDTLNVKLVADRAISDWGFKVSSVTAVQQDLSKATVTLSADSFTYDGTAKQPSVSSVQLGTMTVPSSNYKVTWSDNVNAGTATAKVTATGSGYTGSKSVNFTISQAKMSSATVSLSASSYTYDGTAKKPSVTVKVGSRTLSAFNDYSLAYSNNTAAGTATVKVTGKGNYSGSKSASFTIAARSLANATVTLDATSFTYDGTAKKPAVKSVTASGYTFKATTDYTVAYSSNTNAGTGVVTVSSVSKNANIVGKATAEFLIKPLSFTDNVNVSVSAGDCSYTGNPCTPTVSVTVNGKKLSGDSYTVSYKDNVNAGEAMATVTGKGNYSGLRNCTFKVKPQDISDMAVELECAEYTYDGKAKNPKVVKLSRADVVVPSSAYTVSYSSNTEVGEATVTVSALSSNANYIGSAKTHFTIKAPDGPVVYSLNGATVTLAADVLEYNGQAQTPKIISVAKSGYVFPEDAYTVAYSNNLNAGAATVTLTGVAPGFTGSVQKMFEIAPIDLSQAWFSPTSAPLSYTGSPQTPVGSVYYHGQQISPDSYERAYQNNLDASESAQMTISGVGPNYVGEQTASFTILPLNMSDMLVELEENSYEYDGTEKRPAVKQVRQHNGDLTLSEDEYDVRYEGNVNAGQASVIVEANDNSPNFVGTAPIATFDIARRSIANASVTLNSEVAYLYSGSPITPSVSRVEVNGRLLSAGDYSVSYASNVDVTQSAQVIIAGRGNYCDQTTALFEIAPRSLVDAEITLEGADGCVYTGSPITPAVGSVTIYTRPVSEDEYSVSYNDNVNAGIAQVVVTANGKNYKGSAVATFDIAKYDIAHASVRLSPDVFEYDGGAKTPGVEMTACGQLVPAQEYTVEYADNIEAGIARATVTMDGSSANYTGSKAVLFEIASPFATSIAKAQVELETTEYVFDGQGKEPAVREVKLDNAVLPEGSYVVSYEDNVEAGEAYVCVRGKAPDYSGTVKVPFTIGKADLSDAFVLLERDSCTYSGFARKPGIAALLLGDFEIPSSAYTTTYWDNIDAGTGTVTLNAADDSSFTGSVSASFAIEPVDITGAVVELDQSDFIYDGTAQTPAVVNVTLNNRTIPAGAYEVSYRFNIDVGTACAELSGKAPNGFGNTAVQFEISPLDMAEAHITLSATRFGMENGVEYPLVESVAVGSAVLPPSAYNVDYDLLNAETTGTGQVLVSGCAPNCVGTIAKTFSVLHESSEPVDIAEAVVELSDNIFVYDGQPKTPDVVSVTTAVGEAVSADDYDVSYDANVDAGTAWAVIAGKNGVTGAKWVPFTISPLDISSATVELSPSCFLYDGSPKTPEIAGVKLAGQSLAADAYDAAYSNNVNAGTSQVLLTGKAPNYTGSASAAFDIRPLDFSSGVEVLLEQYEYVYDGSEKQPAVSRVEFNGHVLPDSAYGVRYEDNIGAGQARAIVYGLERNCSGNVEAGFSIAPVDISNAMVTLAYTSISYDGGQKEPAVTGVALDGGQLPPEAYDVSYSDNVNAGTARVTVSGKAPNYTGSVSTTFSIVQETVFNNPFRDVYSSTYHREDIMWLAENGISTGWDVGNGKKEFRPYDDVTRADMAAFLFRLAKKWGLASDTWSPAIQTRNKFYDVGSSTPHANEIWWLAESGISAGWQEGSLYSFRPFEKVARQDMAAFLFRLAKMAGKGGASDSWRAKSASVSKFRDVFAYASDNHHDEVWWLAESGVSAGWDVGGGRYEFRGLQAVARCDMAAFLHRMDAL